MSTELITELVEAGVHFGHQRRKWHPRMKPQQVDEAGKFLAELAAKGRKVLFVGCKRQAQDAVREAAEATHQYFVNHRWLGGTLTNLETIRRSVARLGYLESIEKSPDFKKMSKKELASLARERDKLLRNLSGIRSMESYPDAMVVVDSARESIAIAEARRLGIKIVAMVDSNADPDLVDYPIAANDDAMKSIRIILKKLVDAMLAR